MPNHSKSPKPSDNPPDIPKLRRQLNVQYPISEHLQHLRAQTDDPQEAWNLLAALQVPNDERRRLIQAYFCSKSL